MKNKYKMVAVGTGLQLYRVEVVGNSKLGTVAVISANIGTKELPWTLRWTDFMSTEHFEHYRTRTECVARLEGMAR